MNQKDVEIGKDLIQGHINLIILSLLAEKDRYGYDLYKEVLARTGGAYELKEPSLYSAFRRLESEKLISAYWGDESRGGRRKYYRITAGGKAACKQGLREWNMVKKILDTILRLA
jgi:PadR family transcriptional regulator PadR